MSIILACFMGGMWWQALSYLFVYVYQPNNPTFLILLDLVQNRAISISTMHLLTHLQDMLVVSFASIPAVFLVLFLRPQGNIFLFCSFWFAYIVAFWISIVRSFDGVFEYFEVAGPLIVVLQQASFIIPPIMVYALLRIRGRYNYGN